MADYAGCLKLPHGGQAVAEIAGVGNHIGFGMKGVGAAVGVGKKLDFHGDMVSGSLQREMGNNLFILYHSRPQPFRRITARFKF